MTAKVKKAKRKKGQPRRGKIIGDLHASVEDDLLVLADQEMGASRAGTVRENAKSRCAWMWK